MSRFTTSILLATALLGVLLWIVISMVVDLANAPEEPLPLPDVIEIDPSIPRINTRQDLVNLATTEESPGETLVTAFEDWLETRGYPPRWFEQEVLTIREDLLRDADDAALIAMAGNGDLQAMQELGERSLYDLKDPAAALEWYDLAIMNGSLFAMGRYAELLLTLGDPELTEFYKTRDWIEFHKELMDDSLSPLERSLAWTLAQITIGGFAVIDLGTVNRLETLRNKIPAGNIDRACETAQNYVLEIAAARRGSGRSVFNTDRPPFAVSVPEPESHIPCSLLIEPLIQTDNCSVREFVFPGNNLMNAWFCPY